MTVSFWCLLLMAFLGTACGGNQPEVKDPNQDIPVVNPDTSNGKSLSAFETHVAERTAKGDTVPLDPKKLQNLLVDSIAGYKREINDASRIKTEDFNISEAMKVFYNKSEEYIELTAGDYVTDPDFFRVNLRRHNLAQGVAISGVEDEKRTVEGFAPTQAKDFFSWSSYNSRKKLAWVYIGIDERYFVTIEATAQDSFLDLARVKGWLNWKALW
jgi:hypothetical protein